MEFWEGLWKVVFWLGLALFGSMAIWVTIGGFRDIKKMLRRLREQHEGDEASDKERP